MVKVNATFCSTSLLASYVAMCWNTNKIFIVGIDASFTTTSALAAETQGLLLATSWAIVQKWQDVIIISDCKHAVDNILDTSSSTTWLSNMYGKCRALLAKLRRGCWVSRLLCRRRSELVEVDFVARKTRNQLSLLHPRFDITPYLFGVVIFMTPMTLTFWKEICVQLWPHECLYVFAKWYGMMIEHLAHHHL